MPTSHEDPDDIGAFYKERFNELSDSPDEELERTLFNALDERKASKKVIYIHFDVFGLRIAASVISLVVSSVLLAAAAGVTFVAIKNNVREPAWQEPKPDTKNNLPIIIKKIDSTAIKIPKDTSKKVLATDTIIQTLKKIEKEEQTSTKVTSNPLEIKPTSPAKPKGDNSHLLKEIEEEELFKSKP